MYTINNEVMVINVPKTGTRFVKAAVMEFGDAEIETVGKRHGGVKDIPEEYEKLPVVCVLRDPVSWYVSWINHGLLIGKAGERLTEAKDAGCVTHDELIQFMLKDGKGVYSELMEELGVFGDNVKRYQFTDLPAAVKDLCPKVSKEQLDSLGKIGESEKVKLNKETVDMILSADKVYD